MDIAYPLLLSIWRFLSCNCEDEIILKYRWEYYAQPTTWNDAAEVCFGKGGRLIKLDLNVKYSTILDKVREDLGLPSGGHIWVGFYHDEQSNTNFWQGTCNDKVSDILIDDLPWQSRNQKPDISKPCTSFGGDSFEFRPEYCNKDYNVVCEFDTNEPDVCSRHKYQIKGNMYICVEAVLQPPEIITTFYGETIHALSPQRCHSVSSEANTDHTSKTNSSSSTLVSKTSTLMDSSTKDSTGNFGNMSKQETTTVGGGGLISLLHTLHSITTDVSSIRHPSSSSSIIETESTTSTDNTKNISETTYGVQTLHHTLGTDNTSETAYGIQTLQEIISTPMCESCDCLHISNTVNITAKEINQKIEELKAILYVNKRETVKSKLKLISAKDDRTSSKTIGYIGVILIIIPIIVIALFDVSNLIVFLSR